uniref:LYR motif containing 4 n=1 Tax=Scleropages formosus TaxID=113540 RepID=A0A8C9T6K3_SCLFO
MAASSRSQVLSLYRMLLRESKKFPSYNYRTYALRRVKDAFRENKNVNDPKTVEILLNRARDNLSIIQRQVSPPEETRTGDTLVESKRGFSQLVNN